MDITLILMIVAILLGITLIQNARNDRLKESMWKTMLFKLFLAGFVIGFAVMFWLIPNTYAVKSLFGLFGGILTGISMMIRIPQGWRYVEKHTRK